MNLFSLPLNHGFFHDFGTFQGSKTTLITLKPRRDLNDRRQQSEINFRYYYHFLARNEKGAGVGVNKFYVPEAYLARVLCMI